MNRVEDKHLDVLQNLEFAIMKVYRDDGALHDFDVKDAIDALVRHYHAEQEQRTPPAPNLADRARQVFASVQTVCEWRRGRTPLPGQDMMSDDVIPVSDLVECLRRIQKSVRRWNQQGGRQSYLDFISQFIP